MDPCPVYVIALEPDASFAQWVLQRKEQVRHLAGPQRYLDHPPHLTLYVAAFRDLDPRPRTAELSVALGAPRAVIDRWHVFPADQLTGGHTLVCDVPDECRAALEDVQRHVVDRLAPHRDRETCRRRYATAWERLSPAERDNVERFGFPFVGPIWRAHVTIASIRPEDWDRVRPIVREPPDAIAVCFERLALYVLDRGDPRIVERFPLAREP